MTLAHIAISAVVSSKSLLHVMLLLYTVCIVAMARVVFTTVVLYQNTVGVLFP